MDQKTHGTNLHLRMALLLSAPLMTIPQLAWSQASSATGGSDDLTEIVVTGSRIQRTGFDAPTPTTILDSAQINLVAAPNIGQLVSVMPMFEGTNTPASTTVSSQYAGQNNLNLRGLGAKETLVLVDGRRFVPSTSGGLVDTNVIPSSLIERLDVVTGGASAAYGSDAVAGVVNIILKKDAEGLSGDFQPGISTYSDNKVYKGSLMYGLKFADGKGHVVIAAEGDSEGGVQQQTRRPWASHGYNVVGNPDFAPGNGQPLYLIAPNAQMALVAPGGLVLTGALAGTAFGAGGTPYQFNFQPGDGFYQLGGNGIRGSDYEELSVPVHRYSLYSRGDYDAGPLTVFYEFSHAHSDSLNPYLVPPFSFGDITINSNNYYLNQQYPGLVAQMNAAGESAFQLGRYNIDFGYITADDSDTTDRAVVGLEGKFGGSWKWNVYAEYGRNVYESSLGGNLLVNNLYASANAIAGPDGQPICAPAAGVAPGCVPVNLFGVGAPSQAAIKYFTATQNIVSTTYERDIAGTISGDLFRLNGEAVSMAAGAEYREESVHADSDQNSQAQNFLIGNPQPLAGALSEKEAFVEVLVPVLRNVFLARSLDFNGAIRETDYERSGTVRTWKVGGTWAPTRDVKFRVTRSQDIRAPNLDELFTNRFEQFSPVIIPTTGANVTVQALTGGNPDLKPEIAQTLTGGVVFTPTFVPGLRTSVDYYKIDIKDAISTLTPQNINFAKLSETGIDLEASYTLPLSRLGFDTGGSLRLRALVNDVQTLKQFNGTTTIDYAGDVGGNNPLGLPKWRANFNLTYEQGPFAVDLANRLVGPGNYDNTQPGAYNNNRVPSIDYTDLALQYTTAGAGFQSLQFFVKVNNVFNKYPPIVPVNFFANIQTNPILYDVVGRMFYAGVRFKW